MVKAAEPGRMTLFVGFLFVLLATACGGPSQEEYDEVSQELAATEGDLLDARGQLLAAQERLKELEEDYDEQQEQSDRVAQVLTDTQSELRDVKGQFEAAQASVVELEAIYYDYEWLRDGADLAVFYLEFITDLFGYRESSQPLMTPEGTEVTEEQVAQIVSDVLDGLLYASLTESQKLDLIFDMIDFAILALE